MPLAIHMIGAEVVVGHGNTPAGEDAMGIRFIDMQSGISVEVSFAGEGLTNFREQIKPPSKIEIAQGIPDLAPGVGKPGGPVSRAARKAK